MGPELRHRKGLVRWIALSMVAILCGAILFKSCTPDKTHDSDTQVKPPPALPPAPVFDADSAYAFVKRQVDFGPRVPGSPAHKACADWMVACLERFGADTVIQQTGTVTVFTGQKVPLRNIIAVFGSTKKDRALLLAHYDTRPFADKDKDPARTAEPIPGANDGASGVGILLEIARQAGQHPATIGLDLFFTDVEDFGQPSGGMTLNETTDTWCLGAQYWARNPHVPDYTARFGILLDMCGARDARFVKEANGYQFAGGVLNKVWKTASSLGYGDRFVNDVKYFVGIDDHVWVYQGRGIPTIDIIEFNEGTQAFHPSWHTHDDDLDVIDAATLKAVGQTVTEVVWKER